jgi:hypothetical protein
MGEAKRKRRQAAKYTPSHQNDIARVVRSIDLVTGGGTCLFRAILGHKVLSWLGIDNSVVIGAMLYRAGPHPRNDILCFCGANNEARETADGVLAHYWLIASDQLIDFAVGDWRREDVFMRDNPHDRLPDGTALPPIQWAAPVPDFWWRPAADLTDPWRPSGEPPLGTAWYRPTRIVDLRDYPEATSEPVQYAEVLMRDRVEQVKADWQSGNRTEFSKKTFTMGKSLRRKGYDPAAVAQQYGGKVLTVR